MAAHFCQALADAGAPVQLHGAAWELASESRSAAVRMHRAREVMSRGRRRWQWASTTQPQPRRSLSRRQAATLIFIINSGQTAKCDQVPPDLTPSDADTDHSDDAAF